METTPTTTVVEHTTYVGMKIEELSPYLDKLHDDLTLFNGLLIFLIVYILVRHIYNFIKSFVFGGIM